LRVWLFALVPSLLVGVVGWYAAEAISGSIHWEARLPTDPGPPQALDVVAELIETAREQAETRNGAVEMGVLGAVYGLILGIAGGWSRLSRASALAAGTLGLVVGCAAGALLPYLLYPLFYRTRFRPPDPTLPLLLHVGLYAPLCGAAGLAYGRGLADARGAGQGVSAAAMGGIVGTLFYDLMHTICFPLEWDFSPLPGTALSRLLAFLCVAVVAAVCLASVLARASPRDLPAGGDEAG
jgi:hypothetical protein